MNAETLDFQERLRRQQAARPAVLRLLAARAPHCEYALRFVVAGLLVSDHPPDVLFSVADALREAAAELALEAAELALEDAAIVSPATLRQRLISITALADALADDAPLRVRR